MDWLIGLLFLGVAAALPHVSWRLWRDPLTPWTLYTSAWLAMFGAFALQLIPYIPVRSDTWALLVGSLVFFLLGSSIASLPLNRAGGLRAQTQMDWSATLSQPRFERAIVVLALLGGVGFLLYLRVVASMWGIETLLFNPGVVRAGQGTPGFIQQFFYGKFFLYLDWGAAVLAITYIAIFRRQAARWVFAAAFICIAETWFSGERNSFTLIIVWSAISIVYLYPVRSIDWRRFGISMTALLLLLIGYFVVVGEHTGKTGEYLVSRAGQMKGPDFLHPLASPYIYLTGNIPALQVYMDLNAERTNGAFMLLPAEKFWQRLVDPGAPNISEVGDFYLIPFPFNTFTYLNVFYSDFGVIGLLILPGLFGFVVTHLYVRMRLRPTFFLAYLNGLLVHACLLSFSTNRLVSTPSWELIVVGAIVAMYIRRPQERPALHATAIRRTAVGRQAPVPRVPQRRIEEM